MRSIDNFLASLFPLYFIYLLLFFICLLLVLKPRYVRVNTLRASVKAVIKTFRKEGWSFKNYDENNTTYTEFLSLVSNLGEREFLQDYHIKELLIFPHGSEFHKHKFFADSSILLQDKVSCCCCFFVLSYTNIILGRNKCCMFCISFCDPGLWLPIFFLNSIMFDFLKRKCYHHQKLFRPDLLHKYAVSHCCVYRGIT